MKILMVAAENGALAGGKVGGMGDVIRDIPRALAELGHEVDVIMPGYQRFSTLPGSRPLSQVTVNYRGKPQTVQLFDVPAGSTHPNVRCRVLEHPEFAAGGQGQIYCNDPPERPFASDASKFALFCLGVSQALVNGALEHYQVIHLHDWHSALLAVLIRLHRSYRSLGHMRLVYTIHNLSLQGIRPFEGDKSSLQAWFPELICEQGDLRDQRFPQCYNPMRAAIRLCDRVHAVSPTYAGEIQSPSVPERGFVGGEGLENDLRQAAEQGRLKGILNGCEYPETESSGSERRKQEILKETLAAMSEQLISWLAAKEELSSSQFLALRRLDRWNQAAKFNPRMLVTSVGRLTEQKAQLLRQPMGDGRSALEHLLDCLQGKAVLLVLGSGDAEYERFFTEVCAHRDNLLFLKGYSESMSEVLYRNGDLFLMPSSFEPCGISQMLSMRAGQLCLVHGVGGLLDTVEDNHTGFIFSGGSPIEQAQNMIERMQQILDLHTSDSAGWQAMKAAAKEQRFLWSDVANQYVQQLYEG
nr:putative glycogen synthase [uncultured bacterium]